MMFSYIKVVLLVLLVSYVGLLKYSLYVYDKDIKVLKSKYNSCEASLNFQQQYCLKQREIENTGVEDVKFDKNTSDDNITFDFNRL